MQAAPAKSVPAGHGAGEALGDGVAENEAVGSAPKASALKKGRYAQESLAELGWCDQPVDALMKHQPSEKLKLTDAQSANDKQVARQELKSGANTGPRGTSPPKKSTPVKQDHGAGAASAPEGAKLKRTLATAPFLVMVESDVHLMVRDEPVVVHVPKEVPDVRTI